MRKLFFTAGVATLAIAASVSAAPGGHGGRPDNRERVQRSSDRQAARQDVRSQRVERRAESVRNFERPQRSAARAERSAAREMRAQRVDRVQRSEARQAQRAERIQRVEARPVRQAQRVERQQIRPDRAVQQRVAERREIRQNRVENVRERMADRRDLNADRLNTARGQTAARIEARNDRIEAINDRLDARRDRIAARGAALARRQDAFRDSAMSFPVAANGRNRALIDGCPPGLWMRGNGCMAPGQAAKFIGAPLSTVSTVAALSALPPTVSYLYPDTDDYYWRYGNGYMYQVDRGDDLISALFPLIAGGFIPGQYLPASYMNSYVPNYYGFNSFYQDSPYTCNRYADGVVYQVDCATGLIEGIIPLYANGYGVGQMLPSAYSTYNVPYQYRDLYYDTSDYGYWYGPGAIYQYDRDSSLITSVAALLSPGMTIGQPLPMGYGAYNVPYDYRATYYDTPDNWYRYNNGYIYRVDPTTQLVTAIVASILT